MRIKRKVDILTGAIVTLFCLILAVAYGANSHVQGKNAELVALAKELDILTSLKQRLSHLEGNLEQNLALHDPTTVTRAEQALEEFLAFADRFPGLAVGDKPGFSHDALGRTSRAASLARQILSTPERDAKIDAFGTLQRELLDPLSREIDRQWYQHMERIDAARADAAAAGHRASLVLLAVLIATVASSLFLRVMIKQQILTPILELSSVSKGMTSHGRTGPGLSSQQDEIQELSANFADMAAALKEKMEILEVSVRKEQRAVRELAILNEFTAFVTAEPDGEVLYQRFTDQTRDFMKVELVLFLLLRPQGVKIYRSTGAEQDEGMLGSILSHQGMSVESAIDAHRPLKSDEPFTLASGLLVRNFMTLPLQAATGLQGLLLVVNSQNGFSHEDEDSLFHFAFQAFQTVALQNEVLKLASTDGLTGLYNHRTFQNRISEEVLKAERYRRPLFLLMIDIDHFKKLNDTHGHQAGDDVLRTIAHTIKSSVRTVDFASRYGGEEFAVLLPECSTDKARSVAGRIREAVRGYPFRLKDGTVVSVTISVGVACLPEDAKTKEDLIRLADAALYYAKDSGRDRVCLFQDTVEDAHA